MKINYHEGEIFSDLYVFIDSRIINNSYILLRNNTTIIIDPSFNGDKISVFLKQRGLTVNGILITHGHNDHTWSAKQLAKEFKAPIYVHESDYKLSKKIETYHFDQLGQLDDSNVITFNKSLPTIGNWFELKVLHTPGHTPGSSSYYTDKYVFTGDHIFDVDIGRTDFPYSDSKQMQHSIKIFVDQFKHKKMWVFPGHEEWTLVDELENINNDVAPYFNR
ncbi:MBL fold metallo-hydrolase [[Mycoplasma] testudinis]|uniref:MBL fold metallo-hydrolase n=1 Tax=[Mycoplasma] testudinis TaxID=33924 RepID=UPI000696E171|nr:MBL fold metallo-hydrolase [[Mycoplasma] testudinis]